MFKHQQDAVMYQNIAQDLYDMAMRCVVQGDAGSAKACQRDAKYFYDKAVAARKP